MTRLRHHPQPLAIIAVAGLAGLLLGVSIDHRDSWESGTTRRDAPQSLDGSRKPASNAAQLNHLPLGKAFASFLKDFESGDRNYDSALRRIDYFREPHRSTLREWVLSRWAEENFEDALEYAGYRSELRNDLLAARARLDPDGALDVALKSADERRGEVDLVLAAIAEIDPQRAFALAVKHDIEPNKQMAVTWVAKEPREALEMIFTEWPGVFVAHDFSKSIDQWPLADAWDTVKWLENWEGSTRTISIDYLQMRILQRLSKMEPEEAFAMAEDIDMSWNLKPHLLHVWADSEPQAALQWFEEAFGKIPEKSRWRIVGALGSHIDLDVLDSLVEGLPPTHRREVLTLSLQSRDASLGELLDYAEQYSEEMDAAGFRHKTWWLDRTAPRSVDQLLELAENRSGAIQTELQLCAAKSLLEDDPQMVANLFSNRDTHHGFEELLADESLAREVAGRVAAQWIESDSNGFAQWLVNHPDTLLTSEALTYSKRSLSPAFAAAFENMIFSQGEKERP